MTDNTVKEEIRKKINDFKKVEEILGSSKVFDTIESNLLGVLSLALLDPKLIIDTTDYKDTVVCLKMLRQEFKESFPYKMNWYANEHMLFSWESTYVEVHFRCDPDNVPKNLMPSDTCTVKKETVTREKYYIACEVMRKEFVEVKTGKEAEELCPWASKIVSVVGGYWAFESWDEYEIWRNQK